MSSPLFDDNTTITAPGSISSNITNNTPAVTPSADSGGFMNWLKNNYIKLIIIFIILAFLGFNLFSFLGNATDIFMDAFKKIARFFGFTIGETVKQTIDTVAKGTKVGIDTTTKVIDGTIDVTERALGADPLKKDINEEVKTGKKKSQISNHKFNPSGKRKNTGFCYIGDDKDSRVCIGINESDKCMSGEIFKTEAQCKYPQ